jgi:hypothetical protein
MNNSLKNGIVSGLIAGIVAGIISVGTLYTGLAGSYNPFALDFGNIPTVATIEIALTMIWGMILGLIYSRAHHVISESNQ